MSGNTDLMRKKKAKSSNITEKHGVNNHYVKVDGSAENTDILTTKVSEGTNLKKNIGCAAAYPWLPRVKGGRLILWRWSAKEWVPETKKIWA